MKKLILAALAAACASTPKPAPQAATPAPQAQARVEPKKDDLAPDDAFRARPPPPSAGVEFRAPIPKQLKLKNGLDVFLIERHDVPLVAISLAVRSGEDTDPPRRAGLSSMVLDLLDEGTPSRDAAAIAKGFEDLAARYGTSADADSSRASVTALSDTLDPVLELFADVVQHPAFRAADVERVRVERLGQIAQTLDDPQSVGQHVLSRVIYGEKHPWGYPGEGTVKSVKTITAKDLAAWHKAWFRPSNAALFVVGDTTESALMPILEARLGSWKESAAPKPPRYTLGKSGTRVVTLVDKPGAPQSQIWIGEVGVASGAPDIFPVRVMNNILGGSFNSRLNGNLRSEHAYSYGVFSFFDTHREAGPFVAAGGVVSEKTADALGEFMKELSRMKSGEMSEAELADAKDSLVRAIPALFASNDQTAGAYARAWSHGLPADYYATYQQRVEAVTREDVAKAARDRLHPDDMAIVVVGPLKEIEPRIAALKLGKVELRDAEGEAKKAALAAGAGK
ncbi:MAG TPA: pitrilysin family protein [Myxococcales bacterium]|nr:pitrilysin family protein [Myxococcales bacterium]